MLPGRITQQKIECIEEIREGANWFYWIAGLSTINSILTFSGSGWSFAAGLGITAFLDSIALTIDNANAYMVEVACAACFIGFWVFLGIRANRFESWAFIVGMVFYGIDFFLVLYLQMWLALILHAYALYKMYQGFTALRTYEDLVEEYPEIPDSHDTTTTTTTVQPIAE